MHPGTSILVEGKRSRIIDLREVTSRTTYSKSKIYRLIKDGKFPAQAERLKGTTSAGWFEDDIDNYLETLRPEQIYVAEQSNTAELPSGGPTAMQKQGVAPPLKRRSGSAKIGKVHIIRDQNHDLVPIGTIHSGRAIYLHRPSNKLLIEFGELDLAPLLQSLSVANPDDDLSATRPTKTA